MKSQDGFRLNCILVLSPLIPIYSIPLVQLLRLSVSVVAIMTSNIQSDANPNSINNSIPTQQSGSSTKKTNSKPKQQKPIGSWFLKKLGRKPSNDSQSNGQLIDHTFNGNANGHPTSTLTTPSQSATPSTSTSTSPAATAAPPLQTKSSWRKSSKSSKKNPTSSSILNPSSSNGNPTSTPTSATRVGLGGNASSSASAKGGVDSSNAILPSSTIPVVPGLDSLSEPSKSHGLADTLTIGNKERRESSNLANDGSSSPPPQLAGLPSHEPLGMGLMNSGSNRNSVQVHDGLPVGKHPSLRLGTGGAETSFSTTTSDNQKGDGKELVLDSNGHSRGSSSLPVSSIPAAAAEETAPPLDLQNGNDHPSTTILNDQEVSTNTSALESSANDTAAVIGGATAAAASSQENSVPGHHHQRASSSNDSGSGDEGDESNSRASTKPTTLMSLDTNPGGNAGVAGESQNRITCFCEEEVVVHFRYG